MIITIIVGCIIVGLFVGRCAYIAWRQWRFRHSGIKAGDVIRIVSAKGEESHTVKRVRKSSLTLLDDEE